MSDFDLQWDDSIAASKIDVAIESGLRHGATVIRDEAVERTPRDTGELRDSVGMEVQGNEASVHFGTDHAIVVHENLTAHHATGQAKFLESALTAEAERAVEAIGAEMQRVLDA